MPSSSAAVDLSALKDLLPGVGVLFSMASSSVFLDGLGSQFTTRFWLPRVSSSNSDSSSNSCSNFNRVLHPRAKLVAQLGPPFTTALPYANWHRYNLYQLALQQSCSDRHLCCRGDSSKNTKISAFPLSSPCPNAVMRRMDRAPLSLADYVDRQGTSSHHCCTVVRIVSGPTVLHTSRELLSCQPR